MSNVERLAAALYDKYSQAVGGWKYAPEIVREKWLVDARELMSELDVGRELKRLRALLRVTERHALSCDEEVARMRAEVARAQEAQHRAEARLHAEYLRGWDAASRRDTEEA